MNHIKDILQSRIAPQVKSERAEILEEIRQRINQERIGTKYKPLTGRAIAMKTAHIPTKDLYYLLSICKQSGNWGKTFFGALKVK